MQTAQVHFMNSKVASMQHLRTEFFLTVYYAIFPWIFQLLNDGYVIFLRLPVFFFIIQWIRTPLGLLSTFLSWPLSFPLFNVKTFYNTPWRRRRKWRHRGITVTRKAYSNLVCAAIQRARFSTGVCINWPLTITKQKKRMQQTCN